MIKERVTLLREFKDGSSWWRIACACGCRDHDCDLWFEVDKSNGAQVGMSFEVGYYENNLGFFEALWKRIKTAARILFLGRFTTEGEVILNAEGIEALQLVLHEGQLKMKGGHEEGIVP